MELSTRGTLAFEFARVVAGAGSCGTSDNVPVMVAVERVGSNRFGRIRLQIAIAPDGVWLVDLAASAVALAPPSAPPVRLAAMGHTHKYVHQLVVCLQNK